MFIEEDADLRVEIARIRNPPKRNVLWVVCLFTTAFVVSYTIPLIVRNEFDLVSLSSSFSILGAAVLWWESNHSDADIIPDFNHLTNRRNFSTLGIVLISSSALIAMVLLCLGFAFLFRTDHHRIGTAVLRSVLVMLALLAGFVSAYHSYNRKAFDLQELIRANVKYIKELPVDMDQNQLAEASRKIKQASKLVRNALRSTGFFFLFVGGSLILLDEFFKVWPELYFKVTGFAW